MLTVHLFVYIKANKTEIPSTVAEIVDAHVLKPNRIISKVIIFTLGKYLHYTSGTKIERHSPHRFIEIQKPSF